MAYRAIVSLDIRVLLRLPRLDEVQLHTLVIGPGIQRRTSQSGVVVHNQNVGVSAFPRVPVQQFHHPLAGQ